MRHSSWLAGAERPLACIGAALLLVGAAPCAGAEPTGSPMTVKVQATNLGQKLFQVNESIPAAPGPLRLLFPRWLPGFHGPWGAVAQMSGLMVSAGGRPIPWRRDPADPFAFEVQVPPGASSVDLSFQSMPAGETNPYPPPQSKTVLGLAWHGAVLYPAGKPAADIPVRASLKLPTGWQHGSALRVQTERDGWLNFEPVSLETLVDSPVFAGQHYRRIDLDPTGTPNPVVMHIFADRPERLAANDAQVDAHRAIFRQAAAMLGSRPWRHYDLLLAIGDDLPETALEHHESSENAYSTDYFKDWESASRRRDDLPHEVFHAWNGKYRRPADLWAPDFNTTTQNSLLWVYEGMTQYYGLVLAARAGLVSKAQAQHRFGRWAGWFSDAPGRAWRNLQDTTNDPVMLDAERPWSSWQRGYDYYAESALLIWLDADTLIRQGTNGQRSLDDFARRLLSGPDGDRGPRLYDFEAVLNDLNAVYPHDWRRFLRERLDRTGALVPLDGLERSGWRLAWAESRSEMDKAAMNPKKPALNLSSSLGFMVDKEGKLLDVVWGGPAFKAELAPGDQIVAVGLKQYSEERLEAAVSANKDGRHPVTLWTKQGDDYRELKLDVRTGLRYPKLDRIESQRDWLGEILSPR